MATAYHSKQLPKAISRGPILAFLGLFAVTIAVLGGSSRPDAVQIAALRPLAALFIIPALYACSADAARAAKTPLLIFGTLALWMIVQLVPLAPSLWQALPDRQTLAELDQIALGQETWRPISMVPSRSVNALASLIVPAAAIAFALAFHVKARELFVLIAALGLLDAALCFLQLLTGAAGPFYFYSVTNLGSAVGLFANENHSAVFSSVTLLVAARLFIHPDWSRNASWIKVFSAATFALALLAVFVSGSRAGLVTGLFASACSVVMISMLISPQSNGSRSGRNKPRSPMPAGRLAKARALVFGNPRRLATLAFVALLAVIALFVLSGRMAGLESALNESAFDGLRAGLFPILRDMAGTHWLFGTGFGSFQEVYHIYEPTDLLYTIYVNQAHNDWAQLIIEGGLPALLVLLALLVWIAGRLRAILKDRKDGRAIALFWLGAFGAMMAASIPDYPLRAPLFQVVAVWLVLCLALEAPKQQLAARPR